MTLLIYKTQLGKFTAEEFAQRVEAFRRAMLDHHSTVNVPAPVEHRLVEEALRRIRQKDADDYVADYEIIEDEKAE